LKLIQFKFISKYFDMRKDMIKNNNVRDKNALVRDEITCISYINFVLQIFIPISVSTIGGELCVLARHRMCKLANWSRLSNIRSCSCAPGCATKEPTKPTHVGRVKHPLTIGTPGRKYLIPTQCCRGH
jgi:hypothetical protein